MSKKKKIIVLSCMIALLAVTAVANFALSGSAGKTSPQEVTAAGYFTQYRTERVSSRNEQILQLDAIIASSEAGTETYTNALNQKLRITENMENELMLENLIKATGYEDVVVSIGVSSQNVNVIIGDEDLSKDEALQIYMILQDEIGASPEFVKIIPVS